MQVHKLYKVRLYPNKEQEKRLSETIDACRFVWNYYLAKRKEEYLRNGKSFSYLECSRDLTLLKKKEEYEWLSDVQAFPLQNSLRNLEKAYKRFFTKVSKYPTFKSKNDTIKSFGKPKDWKLVVNKIQLEKNLVIRYRGKIKNDDSILKSINIINEHKKWFAVVVAIENLSNDKKTGNSIGIDIGLTHLAITSEGKKYKNLKAFKDNEKELAEAQQKLSLKIRGSENRKKQKVVVSRIHEKIRNQRLNHLHQTSHRITSENQALIACEDLSVKNMLKNRKLSKAISDAGWSEFVRQLEYKQIWRGGEFIKIDKFFPSSKTCSNCHYVVEKLPLNIREWECQNCGTKHDRDVNAAKVILQQGLRNSLNVSKHKDK